MSEHPPPHGHFTPGPALPDPLATTYGTRWSSDPPADHPAGLSGWADADAPAAVPPAIDPPALRVGWLTGQESGTDPAA